MLRMGHRRVVNSSNTNDIEMGWGRERSSPVQREREREAIRSPEFTYSSLERREPLSRRDKKA